MRRVVFYKINFSPLPVLGSWFCSGRERRIKFCEKIIFVAFSSVSSLELIILRSNGKGNADTEPHQNQFKCTFLFSHRPFFHILIRSIHMHSAQRTRDREREREGNEFFDTKNKSFFPLSGHCTVQRHCLCCGCWLHCGHYSIHINTFSMDFDASESEYRTICVVSSATKQKPKHLFSVHSRLFQYFFFLFFVRWSGRILSVSIREIFHRPTFLLSFFSHVCRLCAVWSVDVDCERALCVCVLIFFNL